MLAIAELLGHWHPGRAGGRFRRLQVCSAAFMALSQGQNDAQKSISIVTLGLFSMGYIGSKTVPIWVMAACALAMALGTNAGGWRIMKTMLHRMIRLDPVQGFAAETSAANVITLASFLGMPVSTTRVIVGSIFGVGASQRLSAVRWGVALIHGDRAGHNLASEFPTWHGRLSSYRMDPMTGQQADGVPLRTGMPDQRSVLDAVVRTYSAAARLPVSSPSGCCASCGCGGVTSGNYDRSSLEGLAQLEHSSLGCGNPIPEADLAPGEVVLDLGCGAGLDTFLAAQRVGADGLAIGLDMTRDMAELAERNRRTHRIDNARFLVGRMERIPLPSESVDAVLSNCVLNLSVDKRALVAEVLRVLRPGGRLVASDIVAGGPVSEELRRDVGLWSACFAGALSLEEWRALLNDAGFCEVQVEPRRPYPAESLAAVGLPADAPSFLSALLRARRPEG